MKKLISMAALSLAAATAQAQILINEFCTASDTLAYKGYVCDWVELYNAGAESVNLKNFGISDNPKKPRKHVIDCDAEIIPGGHVVVLCNGIGTGLNTGFKLSGDGGEEILLSNPDGEIIDHVLTPRLRDDFSYGRTSDGADEWGVFEVATPGQKNGKVSAMTDMPEISPAPGFYNGSQTVTITCSDPSATIYYTTNGSVPTASSSNKYSGPFTVNKGSDKDGREKHVAVRAIAVSRGRKTSAVATSSYFISSRQISLPVVSLVTDRKNFYDSMIGIYVEGKNGVSGKCSDKPVNWNQDWERPVHIEYFDKNHKLQLSQDAGVKITGTCSRTNSMKSLRIIARKEYGDNRLRYKFFDKKDISEFKSIVLRNGGNDFSGTMLRDALITGIAGEGMDVDVQALQPAAVFLNGEYLGMHNIREKVSDHYAEENYGVDDDLVDLLEYKGSNNVNIIDGDNKEYNELIKFVENNSLASKANFDKVAAEIDIDNFIDYWIAQIYVGNIDWPNNNNKWWRARGKNTKWRWVLFGAEFSCNVYGDQQPSENSVKRVLDEYAYGNLGFTHGVNHLMRKLLENNDFKAKFLQRFSYHIDHTFRYARVKEFSDSLKNLVKDEFTVHGQKWYAWLVQNWGNGSNWDNNIGALNNWFSRRPPYVVQHLKEFFNLSGQYSVTVSADCDNAKFSVNGCPSTAKISGNYFAGVTLNLSASLPVDKAVDYWLVITSSGNESKYYSESIDLNLGSDVVVKLYVKDAAPVQYPERTATATGLYVNEVMANNVGAIADEYGNYPAWIEIYNSNNYAIDMAGLFIMNEKEACQIPGGSSNVTTIPAKGHLVFYADGRAELGALHLSFTLKDDKANSVYLGEKISGNSNFLDWYDAPALKKNQSYGRNSDGAQSLVVFSKSTPMDKNSSGVSAPQQELYTFTGEDPEDSDYPTPVSEIINIATTAPVSVRPNPTSDFVTIDCDADFVRYALYTISGQKQLSGVGKDVDMTGLPAGMYILRVYAGDFLQVVKVMKR